MASSSAAQVLTAQFTAAVNSAQNGGATAPAISPSSSHHEDICRICGKFSDVLIDIFGPEGEKNKLVSKLKFCFTSEVSFKNSSFKRCAIEFVAMDSAKKGLDIKNKREISIRSTYQKCSTQFI